MCVKALVLLLAAGYWRTSGSSLSIFDAESSLSVLPSFYTRAADVVSVIRKAIEPCGKTAVLAPHGAGAAGATLDLYLGGTGPDATHGATPVRTRALLVFGEHAREVVPTELAIRLARDLCSSNTAQPRFRAGARNAAYLELLASLRARPLVLTLLPLANAAGRVAVEAGDLCARGNGAGVDVNRNWATHWRASDKHTVPELEPGAAPFSEPETRALRDELLARRPTLFLSVHSGTRGLYAPPAWAAPKGAKSADADVRLPRLRALLTRLQAVDSLLAQRTRQLPPPPPPPAGSAAVLLGYNSPGNCLDYAFEVARTPVPLAFEIWGPPAGESRPPKPAAALLLELRTRRTGDDSGRGRRRLAIRRRQRRRGVRAAASHDHATGMSPAECLSFFNPPSAEALEETLDEWAGRVALLLQLVDDAEAASAASGDSHQPPP